MITDRMRSLPDSLRFLAVVSFSVSSLGCGDSRTQPDSGVPSVDGASPRPDGGGVDGGIGDGGVPPAPRYLAIGYGESIDGIMGCAVRADGTIACNAPRSAIPTFTGRAIAVDPPCALLEGGRVACGDADGAGPSAALELEGEGFDQIAIVNRATFVCGRRSDGTVSCFGGFPPARSELGGGIRSIRGGPGLCAITDGGEVLCGDPSPLRRIPLSGPATDAQGSVSGGCAVLTTGELECWGPRSFDPLPFGPFVRVAVDPDEIGCAIREDGTGTCFGPGAPLAFGGRYADVAMAGSGGWWLTTDGTLERINAVSALAPGRRFERVNGWFFLREGVWECAGLECPEPTVRGAYLDVAAIRGPSVGLIVCRIRPDGTLECDDGSAPSGEFVRVVGDSRFCALQRTGSITCWDPGSDVDSPTGTFESFDLYASAACGVRPDGTLACWGSQSDAQRTGVPTSSDWAAVSVSFYRFHCALARDGRVECWGDGAPTPSVGPYVAVSARFQGSAFEERAIAVDTAGRLIELSPSGATPLVVPPSVEDARFVGLLSSCGLTAEGDVFCASARRYRWMAGR